MAKKLKKVKKVLHEYKEGKLHSGSKKGPQVENPKQAVAIALSEARKAGEKVEKPKKGKKEETKAEKTLAREKHKMKKEKKSKK